MSIFLNLTANEESKDVDHDRRESLGQQLFRPDDHLPWKRQRTSARQEQKPRLGDRTVRG